MIRKMRSRASRIELDALDRRILNVLQENNQLNSQELADRVHSSAPTCLRRLRRLRESGVISREAAVVDPFKVGRDLIAFVHVVLERQTELLQRQFEERIANEAVVSQCYMTSGDVDFILIVNARDMHEYHRFVRSALAGSENIRNFRSVFAMNRSKFDTKIAFDPGELDPIQIYDPASADR